MAFRYRLTSGGHADKAAKMVDRETGKLVALPTAGASSGDILVYDKEPDFVKADPSRFKPVDANAKAPSPSGIQRVSPDESGATDTDSVPPNETVVDEGTETDLNSMTVAQLQAYAEENEIDLNGAKLKGDIIKKIEEATGSEPVPQPTPQVVPETKEEPTDRTDQPPPPSVDL